MNAEGQTTEATLGNGVGTTRSYDAATGLVRSIQSGVGESSAVQDLGYRFDSLGNLTTREDFNQDVYESFAYDRLNRLTGGIVYDADDDTERESKTYRYDAVGNIVNKSDVGAADYEYGTRERGGSGGRGTSRGGERRGEQLRLRRQREHDLGGRTDTHVDEFQQARDGGERHHPHAVRLRAGAGADPAGEGAGG